MAVTLDGLNLGVVTDFTFNQAKRFDDVDLPAMRGSWTEDLGMQALEMELQGLLTGSQRFQDFQQLQRAHLLGQSLKLDSDVLKTVVFIRDVNLVKVGLNFLRYSLKLKESLFKQVCACDALSGWYSTTEGASVTVVSSLPTPFEGSGCVKVSCSAGENEELNLFYEPEDTFSLEDFDWISFSFYLSNVSVVSSAVVTVTEGVNEASYDFKNELTEADKWFRLRVHKTSFTNFEAVDWGSLDKIKFAVTKTQAQNYFYAVDDVGGYE